MEYLNLLSVVAFSYFSSGLTLSAYEFECTECRQHNFSFFIISNFSHFRISPFYSGCYQTNQANIIPTACKSLFCVKLFSVASSSLNTMPFRDAETTWFVRCCFFCIPSKALLPSLQQVLLFLFLLSLVFLRFTWMNKLWIYLVLLHRQLLFAIAGNGLKLLWLFGIEASIPPNRHSKLPTFSGKLLRRNNFSCVIGRAANKKSIKMTR